MSFRRMSPREALSWCVVKLIIIIFCLAILAALFAAGMWAFAWAKGVSYSEAWQILGRAIQGAVQAIKVWLWQTKLTTF